MAGLIQADQYSLFLTGLMIVMKEQVVYLKKIFDQV